MTTPTPSTTPATPSVRSRTAAAWWLVLALAGGCAAGDDAIALHDASSDLAEPVVPDAFDPMTGEAVDAGEPNPVRLSAGDLDVPECDGAGCVTPGACVDGQAAAQFRTQSPPPAVLAPRGRAWVSVTYDNCSGETWTRDRFVLGAQLATQENLWEVRTVPMPADVPHGSRVTIPFRITAPSTPATYNYAWAMVRPTGEPFAETSPLLRVGVLGSADCTATGAFARVVSHVAPPRFVALGARLPITLTLANCSTETWSRSVYRVAAPAGAGAGLWGTDAIALPADVPPGSTVTVTAQLKAPARAGEYPYAWQLARTGSNAGYVGDRTPLQRITALRPASCPATGPAARFLSEHIPGTLVPNQYANVSASFANCGNAVWERGTHRLAPAGSVGNIWDVTNVALALSIGPGFATDFAWRVRAPSRPASYNYRWAIVGPSGALDQPTPAHSVTVRCVPNCSGGRNCGADGCGGVCGRCSTGWSCEGGHCEPPDAPQCGLVQWWNSALTYGPYVAGSGWWDTDLAVSGSTRVQLRHASRLYRYGTYGWGYMPEFVDTVTGRTFRILHLRTSSRYATNVGRVYPAGFVVGLSGGDTPSTGFPIYSTGAHLCIQTPPGTTYRTAFPSGHDRCR